MNTKQLREMLTEELSALAAGKSTNAKATNVARLASSLIASKKLEVQVAKFRIETGNTESEVEL